MEDLIALIHQHVEFAHWIVFGALLLAGFNLPISEDAMLFISAYLAATHPEQLVPLFLGVYLGAYISDVMVYWTGRVLGPRLFRLRMFAKTRGKVTKISAYYERYGSVTLILGRFIPFGVRNALFLTAGVSGMKPWRFLVADGIGCTITVGTYFYLYYTFGEVMVEFVKRANIAIFALLIIAIAAWFIRSRVRRSRSRAPLEIPS